MYATEHARLKMGNDFVVIQQNSANKIAPVNENLHVLLFV